MSYIGVNAEWLKQHDTEVREKVLDKIGFRYKKLMHVASQEEVKNGDLIICAASLHELLIELRQIKVGAR